jgi:hypothetical protein
MRVNGLVPAQGAAFFLQGCLPFLYNRKLEGQDYGNIASFQAISRRQAKRLCEAEDVCEGS